MSEGVPTIDGMRASGTFTVSSFVPSDLKPVPEVETRLPMGVATIVKSFEGEITGHSTTLFTAAFDQATGVGTYVAMEAFEGAVGGREGTFNFVHSAATSGDDRANEFFAIAPSSGTGALAGIRGGGGLAVDEDGRHRIWFDFDFEAGPADGAQ